MEVFYYMIPLFFLTALVYASAGFGGGSTYLALLVLFGFSYTDIPKIALLCNCVVVAGGLYHYLRAGLLPFQKIFPFVVASVPFAFLGGAIPISRQLFLILLGLSLTAAGMRLFFSGRPFLETKTRFTWGAGMFSGGLLGFLSGLVGIGGGIFLSPLLYFLGWGDARQIAAMASFFILVNSVSGLAGQFFKSGFFLEPILPLLLAVFLGGQIGSLLALKKLSLVRVRQITAVLVLFVAARIFWRFL